MQNNYDVQSLNVDIHFLGHFLEKRKGTKPNWNNYTNIGNTDNQEKQVERVEATENFIDSENEADILDKVKR